METTFSKIAHQLLLTLVLLGVAAAAHASWSEPAAIVVPPLENIAPVIHTGNSQIKDGDFGVGAFVATLNAAFKQQTTFVGTMFGKVRNGANTVAFGSTGYGVDLLVSGGLSVAGTITASNIVNTGNKQLCADTTGKIVTCDSGDGGGDYCPEGHRNYLGICTTTVIIDASNYPGAKITNVSGITGFSFAGTLNGGTSNNKQEGYHDLMEDAVLGITAGGPVGITTHLSVLKSNFPLNCFLLPQGTVVTNVTDSMSYVATPTADEIRITIDQGGC